jgi:hypothetical protein
VLGRLRIMATTCRGHASLANANVASAMRVHVGYLRFAKIRAL